MMSSPCYRCHLRHPRCHAECEAYAEWKRCLEENRSGAFPMTAAHEKKIRNDLRRAAKNRADGRGNHEGD